MTVRAILDTKGHNIQSVEPQAKLSSAVKILGERKIGAVLVMSAGRIEGILSERDIVRVLGERGAAVLDEPVSAVMTRKVVSCKQSDTVAAIMEMMTLGKFRHLPVRRERAGRRPDFDRRRRQMARAGIRDGAGSAARLHQDRLNAGTKAIRATLSTPGAAPSGARMWIASWIEMMARSAARAPCAIRSSARWKSNQPI